MEVKFSKKAGGVNYRFIIGCEDDGNRIISILIINEDNDSDVFFFEVGVSKQSKRRFASWCELVFRWEEYWRGYDLALSGEVDEDYYVEYDR